MTIDATQVASVQRIDIKVAPKSAGDKASIASVSGVYGRALTSGGNRVEWDPNTSLAPAGGAASGSSSSSS
jgi:hypothetical protein